jgi:hypothetical protein
MNIFILDSDVRTCAEYHVDKHVVKMVLETTQLLNNACALNDPNYDPVYKVTHKNHPCSLWASSSLQNFNWLSSLGLALCEEYTYRYGKVHKCQSVISSLTDSPSAQLMRNVGLTAFERCMPEQYKVDDPIESYRAYYNADKAYLAKWSKRNAPIWWRWEPKGY